VGEKKNNNNLEKRRGNIGDISSNVIPATAKSGVGYGGTIEFPVAQCSLSHATSACKGRERL